ncbi:MAG: multicopper oxidase family protein [Deltaproteobacteria bacterium]|nr:multicopper oxidase family protein [Deltaproteobacteria bacterium]
MFDNVRAAAVWGGILVAALGLVACGGMHNGHTGEPADSDEILSVTPFEGDWASARFSDLNPDPATVEVELEAKVSTAEYLPGRRTPAWTFNGSVPGPLLEAKVGDQIIVRFRNLLPEPTTIHWHGVRLPAEMDGTEVMQAPVPSGGTFEYRFIAKGPGTFWYHPHVRSDVQVEKGLYGPIIFHDPSEPDLGPQRVIVLDDALLAESGEPLVDGSMMEAMNGRQGNLLLANGRARPVARLRPGQRERWRLVNAANARFFKLALSSGPLTVIGSDQGLLDKPFEVDSLLVVPGERVELLVAGPGTGAGVQLVTQPYDRGHGLADVEPLPVVEVRGEGEPITVTAVPETLRTALPPIAPFSISRTLVLSEDPMMEGHQMDPVFRINGEAFPNVSPLDAKLLSAERWIVKNDSEMDHPFHLHGFSFQVLSYAGSTPHFRTWKDTVNIPAKQTVELGVSFDGFPGRWLFHCHILEHAERGMVGEVRVAP